MRKLNHLFIYTKNTKHHFKKHGKKYLFGTLWAFAIVKMVLMFTWFFSTLNLGKSFAQTEGNIFENQKLIEDKFNLKRLSIRSKIPFWEINTIFEQQCPQRAISEAKEIVGNLSMLRWKNIPKWKIESEMTKRFNLLKKIIPSITDKDKATYCKQKYITYSMLEITQNIFNEERYGDTNEKKVEEWKVVGNLETKTDVKEDVQDSIIEETTHGSAESKKYVRLQQDTTNLSGKEKGLAQIAEESIQSTLETMLNQRILKQEDIKALDGTIKIQYNNACKKTTGSFHVTRNKSTKKMTFKEIKLNINICSNEGFYSRFEDYVKQIFAHELGHYVYFFKDSQTEKFEQICRNEEKKLCKKEGFFSTYAQNNKEEDYAESFAYWYLDTFSAKKWRWFWSALANEIQGQKENYFNELHQRLK